MTHGVFSSVHFIPFIFMEWSKIAGTQRSSLCPDLDGLIDLLNENGYSARDANTLGRQLFSGIRCQVCGLGSSGCQASLGSGGCADVQIMVYPGILDPSRIFGWQ